jgi:hypothetical protein
LESSGHPDSEVWWKCNQSLSTNHRQGIGQALPILEVIKTFLKREKMTEKRSSAAFKDVFMSFLRLLFFNKTSKH